MCSLSRRFDHHEIFAPLEAERDALQGKHVNTQLPKIIGAARLYELTGEKRYETIARFFWDRAIAARSRTPIVIPVARTSWCTTPST